MRLYSFVNSYLSPLQHGLQTAHLVAELSRDQNQLFQDWASQHKTIIILNGGNQISLIDLFTLLDMMPPYSDLHYGAFREDFVSLNGCLTCVGFVASELLCRYIDIARVDGIGQCVSVMKAEGQFDQNIVKLIDITSSCRLA